MSEPSTSTTSGLLAHARAGEVEALNRLFEVSRPWLTIAAQARLETWLRSRADPSDLVQQTLLEAYRDFASFAGHTDGEWLAW